jgi:hypothetical protein
MRWAGHVARIGDTRDVYSALVVKTDGKQPLGGSKRRWGMISKYIFKKWDGEAWTGLIWLRIGTGGGRLSMQ